MEIVRAENLVKDYGSLRAVDSISFAINRGECFGFLGPNGAGKTTVMGIIYCFIPPTSGTVRVFGEDVTRSPAYIKSRSGVMPQDNNLDPDLSVFENLVVYARYFDISARDSTPKIIELLNQSELQDKAHVNIKDLSGGMKRKLLLARALINDPELVILDEPTTGLDPHTRHAVWLQLKGLKSRGITFILTTHYMEEAEQLCDRVAIMDSAKIVTVDTPQRLMTEHGGNLEHVYMKLTGKQLVQEMV